MAQMKREYPNSKIKSDEFDFYVTGLMASPMECPACHSKDTEPITDFTHSCNDCGESFDIDNQPPTPEEMDAEDIRNMFLDDEF